MSANCEVKAAERASKVGRGQARWGEGLGGRGREGWLGAERDSQKGSGSAGCEVRATDRASKVGRGPGQ